MLYSPKVVAGMKPRIAKMFIFLIVATMLSSGTSFYYEHNYASESIKTIGEITSFRRKTMSSGTSDPIEMVIEFIYRDDQRHVFYTSRNVIEHVTGKYKVGDKVPVLYNATGNPIAKIGYIPQTYKFTLMFLVAGCIFLCAQVYVWRKST